MFSLFRKKEIFNAEERERIVQAIRAAEKRTSGEVRVYIESRCRFINPMERAWEMFFGLKMDKTDDRNAVLFYIAWKDRQLAIFADEGIHKAVGAEYWNTVVKEILAQFSGQHYVDGIIGGLAKIGEALHLHFPYESDDKNELPDEIVFGK
jgi:uncharacterized membrane protein